MQLPGRCESTTGHTVYTALGEPVGRTQNDGNRMKKNPKWNTGARYALSVEEKGEAVKKSQATPKSAATWHAAGKC